MKRLNLAQYSSSPFRGSVAETELFGEWGSTPATDKFRAIPAGTHRYELAAVQPSRIEDGNRFMTESECLRLLPNQTRSPNFISRWTIRYLVFGK
jgi:hypothetical protein